VTNPEVRIYSPTPLLGYGYQPQSFDNALRLQPHLFALDGGSSDPGPNYLGGTESFSSSCRRSPSETRCYYAKACERRGVSSTTRAESPHTPAAAQKTRS
jgi:hypothetical protein